MKQLLLAIPAMMEEVLKKVEQEDLNASDDKKRETKKLLSNLRKVTTEMKNIAESQEKVSQQSLFSMLGNLQELQDVIPKVDEDQLSKLKDISPDLGNLLSLKDSLGGLPDVSEAMRVLSPTEKVRENRSLKEGEVEKTTESQPKTDRVNPAKIED